MSPKLDAALCKDFPLLYADRCADKMSTCMCWGFSCGDGWEPLIRRLSEKIEPIIADLTEGGEPLKAVQVKEKFGTLRFYMSWEHSDVRDLIKVAEHESRTTCEECGQPGKMLSGGWCMVRCPTCAAKR